MRCAVPDYSWSAADDWQDAWASTIGAVGTDFGDSAVRPARDQIEAGAVRRYLEPLEFDCPLHSDADIARKFGYRDIVAPYSGLATWCSAGLWKPGDEPVYTSADKNAQPEAKGIGFPRPGPATNATFATDLDTEFFAPMCVGDHLSQRGRVLLSCVPKQTRVGRGAFLTWQSDVVDQCGKIVALVRTTAFNYVAAQQRAGPAPAAGRDPDHSRIPRPPVTDWSRRMAWGDFSVGDAIPPMSFPLSMHRLIVQAGANQDFASIHHNSDWARRNGAGDFYANNVFLQGMWERAVRGQVGLPAAIRRIGPFRMKAFSLVGETVVVHGTVCRTWQGDEPGVGFVEFSMSSEVSSGTSVTGSLVVALPCEKS